MGLWTERKRWTWRKDLNRRIWRSRWRVLVRDFGPIVGVLRGAVMDRGEGGPVGCPITAQLVGDQAVGNIAQPLQQLAKEPFGRPCIPAFLHEDIQRQAILIYRSP